MKAPSLSFPVGTQLVDLPSAGKYYKKEHPLFEQQAVEIVHMTGEHETILTNRDYIKKEIVLDKLVQSILVDPRLKEPMVYNEILSADRLAILYAARKTAYTSEYEVGLNCPKCKKANEFTFSIDNLQVKNMDPVFDEFCYWNADTATFTFLIPVGKIKVEMKLKTVDIENRIGKMKNPSLDDVYNLVIVSVNDYKEQDKNVLVKELFSKAPASWLAWLRNCYNSVNPDLSLLQTCECVHCEHVMELEPPINSSFLFPTKKIRLS